MNQDKFKFNLGDHVFCTKPMFDFDVGVSGYIVDRYVSDGDNMYNLSFNSDVTSDAFFENELSLSISARLKGTSPNGK